MTLTSKRSVALQKKDGDGEWVDACVAPCATDVRVDRELRVEGSGISLPIVLEPGDRKIDVRIGDPGARTTGFLLVGVSVAAVGGGLFARWVGTSCDETCNNPDSIHAREAGTGLLVGGAFALVAGTALLLANPTSVTVDSPRPLVARSKALLVF